MDKTLGGCYFTALLDIIGRRQGDIIRFGSDLVCGSALLFVIDCLRHMFRSLDNKEDVPELTLNDLSSGPLRFFVANNLFVVLILFV